MGDSATLFASLFWGSVGLGLAIYGKREQAMAYLFGGVAVMAVSYFVSSALYMSVAEVGILAAVFWLQKRL